MHVFVTLLNAHLHVLGADVLWREIVGNVFGLGSAVLGMQRRISAWWIGLIGNALLITVFLGGTFHTPQDKTLWGQVGRQAMFAAVSIYGWWLWQRTRRAAATGDGGRTASAVQPRWATNRERFDMLLFAMAGVGFFTPVLTQLNSYGPLSDAWILTGSLLATAGMALGLREFWLVWIAVDAVGVPLLLRAHYYPSALMYIVYGVFCLVGFVRWALLDSRAEPAGLDTRVEVGA